MQDQAQVLLAGSAAVRAILSALKFAQPEQAAAMAVKVAASLLEVCQRLSSGHFAPPRLIVCPMLLIHSWYPPIKTTPMVDISL